MPYFQWFSGTSSAQRRICEAVPEVGQHIVADMQGERGQICSHGVSGFGSGIVRYAGSADQ